VTVTALLVLLDGNKSGVLSDAPKRIGLNGKPFSMYKLRTMIPNAHSMLNEDPHLDRLLKKKMVDGKLRSSEDPRITKVGRFLRWFDLDERPQLWNVVKGEMSLVGPRPYFASELDECRSIPGGAEMVKKVISVKPGMTGLWQVSGRNDIPLADRLKVDATYAETFSFFQDLLIALKTPIIVLTRKGAW